MPVGYASDSPLRVYLFGQPHLEWQGQPFRLLGGRHALAILCVLALRRRAPISRDALAFTLWPDVTEEAARRALRRELHRLLKALPPNKDGPAWVLADEQTIQWNPSAPTWIDVDAFERALEKGQELPQALSLYGGDLLETIHDDWVFADRERLRAAYMSGMSDLLASYRSCREYSAAIVCAQGILTADNFREDILRQLMLLRYESGDRAGALRDCQHYAQLYKEELGTGLMPETQALRDAIARNELEPERAVPQHEEQAERVHTRFLGRTREFERTAALWARAARGAGTTLFVSGEAGIGKSRFAHELRIVADRQGGRTLIGATSHPERRPYEPIASALFQVASLLAGVPADSAARVSLSRILPQLAERANAHASSVLPAEPQRERLRLFAALEHYVTALARTRPLLIVLEDVHWARPSTLAAIRAISLRISRESALLVLTYREEECSNGLLALRRELQESTCASHVALRRLTLDDAEQVARNVPELVNADDATARELAAFSEGNPFLLTEGIAQFIVSGTLPTISSGIAGIVGDRLARLSPLAADMAQTASAIGDAFAVEVIRRTGGLEEGTVLDAIDELIDQRIVQQAAARSRFDYAFTHHLIRASIYAQIPESVRARRHRRIAHVLEELAGSAHASDAADIARHYDLAAVNDRAAHWYTIAAQHAIALYANEEALSLVTRALELCTDERLRFGAHAIREALRDRLGDLNGQEADLLAMTRIAAHVADEELRIESTLRRIDRALKSGENARAGELMDSIAEARSAQAPGLRGRIDLARARLAWNRCDFAIATECAEAALPELLSAGNTLDSVKAQALLAEAHIHSGHFDAADRWLEGARSLCARDDTNAVAVGRAFIAAARAALTHSRWTDAERLARTALHTYEATGDIEGIGDARQMLGVTLGRLMRFEEAIAAYNRALQSFARVGKRVGIAAVSMNLSILHAWLGQLEHARTTMESARVIFTELGDRRGESLSCQNLSYIDLMEGAYERARENAERSAEIARAIGDPLIEATALGNLGAALRELGRVDESIALLERALSLREEVQGDEDLAGDRGELALAYLAGKNLERAVALAERILSSEPREAAAPMPHLPFFIAARVFAAAGEQAQQARALQRAQAILEQQLAAITDEELRRRFLELPPNRALTRTLAAPAI